MKKLLGYIAVAGLVLTFTACGNNDKDVVNKDLTNNEVNVETSNEGENKENEVNNSEVSDTTEENKPVENKPAENKPAENKPAENKPAENKPAENKPVENKPAENKPVENKPSEDKPVENKPEENKPVEELPQEKPENKEPETLSVGKTLLKDFQAKAASATSVLELADSLVHNSIIPFMGGALEVSEGYLSGFDNVEIKGFKSGAMFAPMIGSIPFVGYVFELESEADVSSFIKTLEDNANLRWNICVTADEMVTGSVGNKVFFVMAPTQFEA